MYNSLSRLLTLPLVFAIYFYRFALSGMMGGVCRFNPTCSEYAEEALKKHGAFRGVVMSIMRLLRCHPWHEGGFDPVPESIDSGDKRWDKAEKIGSGLTGIQ